MISKHLLLASTAGLACAMAAIPVAAQTWPARAVRIINPFPAGGGTDAFARPLASVLPADLGQQVIIENLGGAGGTVGAAVAARATPDGYTWFMGAVHHTIAETIYKKLSYGLERDFVPVTLVASVPSMVVVHPSLPVKTVKELIALDKRSPGNINYGSAGTGTTHHMNGELFNLITGTKLVHVPYKGAGPLTPALLSGEVAMAFDGMGTAAPNVRAGRLRGLAVTTAKRSELMPELPTLIENGINIDVTTWYALWGIRGTPQSVVERMHQAIVKALAQPKIKTVWDSLGASPGGQPPADFGRFVRQEIETWGKVVRASGVTIN